MEKEMEKETQKYRVDIHLIAGIIAVGSTFQPEILSEVELQSDIWFGTELYEEKIGRKPELLSVKVWNDGEVAEYKLYKIHWTDDNSFQLLTESVLKEGNLFNITMDLENLIEKEAGKWKIKDLTEKINQALDEGNKEAFLQLTGQLIELQTVCLHE